MNKIKFLTLVLLFASQLNIYGQEMLSRERETEIRNSGRFYYSESSALNEAESKAGAIKELTQKVIMDMRLQALSSDEETLRNAVEMRAETAILSQTGRVIILAWIEKESVLKKPDSGITAAREMEIRNSGRYYYSECSLFSEAEAIKCATNELIQKVIVDMVHQTITSEEAMIRDAVEMRVETAVLSQNERISILAWVEKESVRPKVNLPHTTVEEEKKTVLSEADQTPPVLEPVFVFNHTASENMRQTMQNNARAVFRQIHEAYNTKRQGITGLSDTNATSEAIKRIQTLWSTSKFFCRAIEVERNVLQTPNGRFQVRGVPVMFVDGDTEDDKKQELVLEFTREGKINDMYITVYQGGGIIENADDVTETRHRYLVLDFVENFRTAYNRKDIDFITNVFSEYALIITGTKDLKVDGDGLPTLTVIDKQEYIKRLKNVFDRNAFINVKFENIKVVKHDREPNVYGVELIQHWNATGYNNVPGYSDVGRLFLMIDFRKEDEPLIWVRAWQPLNTKDGFVDLGWFQIPQKK